MNVSNSIFKFVTIRNTTDELKSDPKFEIQLKTELTNSIVAVLTNDQKQPEKIKSYNKILDDFIKGRSFYKTKIELIRVVSKLSDMKPDKKNADEFQSILLNIYDNIVIRTITKSNTNEVYKLLIDSLKSIYQIAKKESIRIEDISKLKIVLPEGLILTFSLSTTKQPTDTDNIKEKTEILTKINELLKQKEQIKTSKSKNSKQLREELNRITKQQNENAKAQMRNLDALNAEKKASTSKSQALIKEISKVDLNKLISTEEALDQSETNINLQINQINNKVFQYFPKSKYAQIGEKFVDITNIALKPAIVGTMAVTVYLNDCELKFPFQVADLRVVEQKTVGYLPHEIAHINNTQSGERQEKVTRRLKRIETFDSLITEDEVTKETDTQSTEKFSLEKAASDVQSEENTVNVNTSVMGTYGVVTASLDAGFSHSDSSTNSNSSSQSYAKEVVQKVVDRVSKKVKSERSLKSIEEFEETVTHIIDNTINQNPKSYVYRWLTKLVRATLKNYGKRLIFQIDVAHPSNYYLSRMIDEKPSVNIPLDPRILKKDSSDPLIQKFYLDNPAFPSFSIDEVNETNYLAWADLYGAKLEQPNEHIKVVSWKDANLGDAVKAVKETVTIPAGYEATEAKMTFQGATGWLFPTVGLSHFRIWHDDNTPRTGYQRFLNYETGEIPITVISYSQGNAQSVNIEISCSVLPSTIRAWQIKCYHAIIEAYENLKAEAESKMSEFNPNNPGLNPGRKTELIRTELKKGALTKMYRCNPYWIKDNYEVGKEYDPNCCADNMNAEKIRFLESTFDWKNMTYELHPYFYADKDNWTNLLDLTDDDPHFEAFLQASYATLRIPVYRDSEKEIAAINFILNNSIANHSVVPAGMQHILDDLSTNTPFDYIAVTQSNIPFVHIKKEFDRTGKIKIFYIDELGAEVICTEKLEFDKEGNQTLFYYNTSTNQVVISEIKEVVNKNGQKVNYYFNSADEKIITNRTKIEYDIEGNSTHYYSTDLGIFSIPTDLVILEAGVQDGVKMRGYPEDASDPTSDTIIPKQYSPAIIQE